MIENASLDSQTQPLTTERDRILRRFPYNLGPALVEYNKAVSEIDADYIIMMARKALRLHDLLVLAGGRDCKGVLLSHHVLEQAPHRFVGKRVALVDDTLIVGTTLAKALRTLREIGASEVTTHVFCVDKDNWCQDLIVPDSVTTILPQDQVLTFCAAEVSALAHSAIPYLSDFPVTETIKISRFGVEYIHAFPGWTTYSLTTPSQEAAGVSYYTFLPKHEALKDIKNLLGEQLFRLIDIVKVRAFCKKVGANQWSRIIPIITICPLSERDVEVLFDDIQISLGFDPSTLKQSLKTPKSQLRWIQYALSLLVGRLWLSKLENTSGKGNDVSFDLREANRLFGPWMTRDIQTLHQVSEQKISPNTKSIDICSSVSEAQLPYSLVQSAADDYRSCIGRPSSRSTNQPYRSIFTDLARAFIELYKRYEVPARAEAKKLGSKIFECADDSAPHRDRLQYGFAWRVLADQFVVQAGKRLSKHELALLSLPLDHLIDLGIAVPVLCHRHGLLFRAYRHGEDVLFGDQELALAYDAVAGFLEGADREAIPAVMLEKLISSLIRVGAAKEYLSVLYGETGGDGLARIGFHLHGAVPIMPANSTIFADNRDAWISGYMVDRGVINKNGDGGYSLGERPDAALRKVGAGEEARQLGLLMGMLARKPDVNGQAVLNSDNMILLATCILPRDVAAALAAELRIFADWYDRNWRQFARKVDWKQIGKLENAISILVRGRGYTALHSARLKISGYYTDAPKNIIEEGEAALKKMPHGNVLGSLWRGAWMPVLEGASDEQRVRFGEWIRAASQDVLASAMSIFTIELALSSALAQISPEKGERFRNACQKSTSFINAMSAHVAVGKQQARLRERLVAVTTDKTPMQSPREAFAFAMTGLDDRLATLRSLASQIEDVVLDYGRMAKRMNYSYVLWYDIIDSLGQKSGLSGSDLREYRDRIRKFKSNISRDLYGLCKDAHRQNANIYSWKADINSFDDEKHLFFLGSRPLEWVMQASKILFRRAKAHDVKIRVLAVPAGFAGIAAYKYANEPEVQGPEFWENLSRLQMAVREEERAFQGRYSFFWIAERLVKNDDLRSLITIDCPKEFKAVNEIENASLQTQVWGGRVVGM